MKSRAVACNRALTRSVCGKAVWKHIATLFCCVLLLILSTGANPVAAARYKLPEQGDNVDDCFCCIPTIEAASSQVNSPPPSMPGGCFQRLGAIGLMCYVEDQPSPTLEIWGVTSESQGFFLLRVSQSQINAVRPAGPVAETADDYVKVCVREDRDVEVSMGPGPEGKTHHVTLQGGLLGPVRGTRDTHAAPSDIQDTVTGDVIVHVVQYGETLFAIAKSYNVPMQDIMERNRLGDGNQIYAGQKLDIRDASRQLPTVNPQAPRPDGAIVHVVQYGETLFPISYTYNVPMQDIIERNRLADGDLIRPGQALIIRDAS